MVGNLKFVAPILHAFLPLCLAQSTRTSGWPCLDPQDRVPETQLRNLSFPTQDSVPVGLVGLKSAPDLLATNIARILMQEVMGYNVRYDELFNVQGGRMNYYIAGCKCPGGAASCAQPNDCSSSATTIPEWQFGIGAWSSQWENFVGFQATQGDNLVLPDIVVSQGWRSFSGVYVFNESRHEAMEQTGVALEYYKGFWHESVNGSHFFLTIDDFDDADIQLCAQQAGWRQDIPGLLAHYSVEEFGMPVDSDGVVNVTCYKDRWWLGPGCRNDPHSCIPLLVPAVGLGLREILMKTMAYNLPWAIATVPQFFFKLAKYPRVLSFGVYPDNRYDAYKPSRIIFPSYDSYEWSQGNRRTGSQDGESYTIVNPKVRRSPEGNFLTKFLQNLKFSTGQVDSVLANFAVEHARLGSVFLRTMEVISCDWVHSHRDTWEAWIPKKTLCDVGSGLIIDVASPGSFTLDESLATDCVYCTSGRYSAPFRLQDGGLSHVCKPCPQGQEQLSAAEAACTPCKVGKYKEQEGTDQCVDCRPGNHSATTGQTACTPCELGRSAPRTGMAECTECFPAEFADVTGKVTCDFCTEGKFASDSGSSACTECTSVLAGSTSSRASGSAEECVCPSGTFLRGSQGCVPCWEGLLCPGGQGEPLQLEGFWVDTSGHRVNRSTDYQIYRCRAINECPRGTLGSCASGREGVACNDCKDFYYSVEEGGCDSCDETSLLPTVATIVATPLLFIAVVMVVRMDASRQHLTLVTAGAVAGQVVNLVQLLAATGQIAVQLPEPLRGLLEVLGPLVLDLDMLRLSCMFGTNRPVAKFIMQLLVYPCFLALLLSSLIISRLIKRPLSTTVLFNLNGTVLFTLYISMALAMMIPFQCRRNPSGFTSMVTDPGLKCFEDEQHYWLVGLAILGILIYPVGIAVWLTYVTWSFKSWLHSAAGIRRLTHYRFLFGRFDPESYFFGVLYLLRNLILAALPVYLVQYPTLQVLGMLAVLLVGTVVQASIWPWRTNAANQTDRAFGIVLVLLIAGIGTLLTGDKSEVEDALSIMLTVMLILAFIGAVGMLLHSLFRRYRGAKAFDFFLCHHKAGAGSLCRLLKMLVENSSSAVVFIDSDHLNNLDLLFDTVRSQVGHLVVVLSQSVLSRHWCAGEIVTAHRNGVHMVPLVCDGFERPGTQEVEKIIDGWTGDEVGTLGTFDISVAGIKEAYAFLLGLPMLHLPLFQGLVKKEGAMIEVMTQCFALPTYRKSMKQGTNLKPAIVVAGGQDSEALSACEIMQVLLQQRLEVEVSVARSVEDIQACAPHVKIFLTLFSRGLLHDPYFGKIAYAMFGHPEASPHVLTAVADSGFQFPPNEFVQGVEEVGLLVPGLGKVEGPGLAKIYQTMLSVLARPFTPLASKGAISEQVNELCGRARPLLEKKADRVIPAVDPTATGPATASNWSKMTSDRIIGFTRGKIGSDEI